MPLCFHHNESHAEGLLPPHALFVPHDSSLHSATASSDVTMSTLSSSGRTVVRQIGIRQASTSSCRVLVVGSGTAGLAVSSKLSRSLGAGAVSLLDSREVRNNNTLRAHCISL